MFEKRSFLMDVKKTIKKAIESLDAKHVIWFGEYHGFPIVYKILLDIGVSDIEIVDNSVKKQGIEYYPFGSEGETELKKQICAPDVIREYKPEEVLVLLSNTHFTEICAQLSEYGIKQSQIIDLMKYNSDRMWAIEKPIVDKLHRLEGRGLQLRELEILKVFKEFCNANKLTYFLAEGSMIGAIRHKGFIPWDDDIDVFMPFEDYERFISMYPANENYEVCDWRIYPDYPYQFAKFTDKHTRLLHPCLFGYTVMGCCIDVFPIAGYPSDKKEIEKKWARNRELDAIRSICCCVMGIDGFKQITDIKQVVSDEKYALSFYDSEFIGTMQQIRFEPWVVRKETFSSTVEVLFEGEHVAAPVGYDEYLTVRYGDYMKLPPVEARAMHPYPIYVNE